MKTHKILNYSYHILITLCIVGTMCILQGCSTPTDLLYSFLQSPRFKSISYNLIPENSAKESEVEAFISSGKAVIGNDDPYHDPVLYSDSLTDALSASNSEDQKLYTFLFQHKYLILKSYYLKMERKNVPGKVFLLLQRDFYHYRPSLDRFLIRADGKCMLQLGQRKLDKITFSNSYDMNVAGTVIKVRVYKFSYHLQATLSGLPGPGGIYEGTVKFVLDPDDGRWHLDQCSLPDKGTEEFLGKLTGPRWTDWTATYARQAEWRRQQERGRQLKTAKKFTFTIGTTTVQIGEAPKETYLGVLTSDDAIKIEPVRGSYSFINIDLVPPTAAFDYYSRTSPNGGWPLYRIGQTVQFTGDGGGYQEYRTNGPVFFDLQGLGHMNTVQADAVAVYLFGSPDARAKVTIYCVDNSDTVNSYGTSIPNEKSFFPCSKRFQNIGTPQAKGASAEVVQKLRASTPANQIARLYGEVVKGRIMREWACQKEKDSTGLKSVIAVLIKRTGEIARVVVIRKSGNELFDEAGVRAVNRAGPLPPVPPTIIGGNINFILTFMSGQK